MIVPLTGKLDIDVWEKLIDYYGSGVYLQALLQLGNVQSAQEVCNRVFWELYCLFAQIEDRQKLPRLINIITSRQCAQASKATISVDNPLYCFQNLPDNCRLPVALKYIEQKSSQEISALLGIKEEDVTILIANGEKMLPGFDGKWQKALIALQYHPDYTGECKSKIQSTPPPTRVDGLYPFLLHTCAWSLLVLGCLWLLVANSTMANDFRVFFISFCGTVLVFLLISRFRVIP